VRGKGKKTQDKKIIKNAKEIDDRGKKSAKKDGAPGNGRPGTGPVRKTKRLETKRKKKNPGAPR